MICYQTLSLYTARSCEVMRWYETLSLYRAITMHRNDFFIVNIDNNKMSGFVRMTKVN